MRTGTATVTAIAVGIVVVVIPIGASSTINAAIRMRCHRHHIRAPNGGVVVDTENAIVADAPAAPPLPPSGATDPMAAALTQDS